MVRSVRCLKLNKEAVGLEFPPYPGELGKKIYEFVSKEAWLMWMDHQTILINENRLSLADPEAQRFLKQELDKFLFGNGSETPAGFVPKFNK